MSTHDKNNYISIAKAIGITLMVIGHSGCPSTTFGRFIYLFHMPLFFFCSGYFFKEIADILALKSFVIRRFKGIYIPYIKWSILFLLLHNVFCQLNLYNDLCHIYPYNIREFLTQFCKTILMTDYEVMLRPFWFLKVLLYTSILVGAISYLTKRFFQKHLSTSFLLVIMVVLTLFSKLMNVHIPVLGDCSVILLGGVFYYSGLLFRRYEKELINKSSLLVISFLITLTGSFYFQGIVDMRFTTASNLLFYCIFALSGIIFVFSLSKTIENKVNHPTKNVLYYLGSHTMPILALHLLSFRIVSLFKIWIYDLPIEKLSSHTMIPEYNHLFWLLYTVVGLSLPLLLDYLYGWAKVKCGGKDMQKRK